MEVFVNHECIRLDVGNSLITLLDHLQIAESRGIALAVNNEVIPRKSWSVYPLSDQDRITLIRASQGG
jgi:sulfur carrier protein